MDKYLEHADKLKRHLATILLDDHLWYLKSWDVKDKVVIKIHFGECTKDFGGRIGNYRE